MLLNTCHIREKACEKLYSDLGRLKSLKTANPDMKIAGDVTVKIGDILQIIGNLLSNAVHAVQGAGTVTVTLAPVEGGAKLVVADNGAGMEEAVRQQAMQPFFSTKVDGEGTGVGLYIVQKIVHE